MLIAMSPSQPKVNSSHSQLTMPTLRSASRPAFRVGTYNAQKNFYISNTEINSMRSIVSGFASSLDGYIEGPNGEYDWILIDKEVDFAEQMKRYDAFLYGRRTYESVRKM